MPRFSGTPVEETEGPRFGGTPVEEPAFGGTPVDAESQAAFDEKPKSLPEPEELERGRIKERYQLSDGEYERIRGAFESGYKESLDKDFDLADRAWLNARQSFFANTLAGNQLKDAERGSAIRQRISMNNATLAQAKQASGGFGPASDPRVRELERKIVRENSALYGQLRQAQIEGLAAQARRAGEYAGMPDYSGPVEGASALAGQLAGGILTPETFIGAGAGKTVMSTLLRQGGSNALVNAATNPFIQAGNIASGDQSGLSGEQFAADVAVGTVAPALFKSPKLLKDFMKSRKVSGLKADLAAEGVRASKTDAEGGLVGDVGEEVLSGRETPSRASKAAREAGIVLEKGLVPVSSRLERMVPGLGKSLRRHAYQAGILQAQAHSTARPFLKQFRKMPKSDRAKLDLALKNQDAGTIAELLDKHHMKDTYQAVRLMLDDFHSKARNAGFEVGYLKDYFPRRVKDYDGLMDYIKGQKEWGIIERSLEKEAKKMGMVAEALPPEARAEIISKILRGYGQDKIDLGPESNLKERRIKELTDGMAKFYHDTPTSLLQYVDNVSRLLSDRQFFGKNADDVQVDLSLDPDIVNGRWRSETIGGLVDGLVRENRLDSSQQRQVLDIMNAYFGSNRQNWMAKGYKSLIHLTALNSPINAITQFGDLAPAMYRNGLWNGVMGLKDAVSPKRIRREDIGNEQVATEFADFGKLAKLTDLMFKLTGFSFIDRLGKETFINGRFRQLQKRARAPKGSKTYDALAKELRPALKESTEETIEAFARGDKTDANVRFALFDSLSDFQPITRAEMPEAYLKYPNGRIFYTLKTFTIRQFDALRREAFDEMKKGNVAKGMRNLVRLGGYWIAMGASADFAKDFILGRESDPGDLAVENMLKTMGVTRWSVYKARDEGIAEAVKDTIAPPTKFFTDLQKDAQSLSKEEFEAKHAESIQSIPWVGKIYYWRFGRGVEKEEERRRRERSDR